MEWILHPVVIFLEINLLLFLKNDRNLLFKSQPLILADIREWKNIFVEINV